MVIVLIATEYDAVGALLRKQAVEFDDRAQALVFTSDQLRDLTAHRLEVSVFAGRRRTDYAPRNVHHLPAARGAGIRKPPYPPQGDAQ